MIKELKKSFDENTIQIVFAVWKHTILVLLPIRSSPTEWRIHYRDIVSLTTKVNKRESSSSVRREQSPLVSVHAAAVSFGDSHASGSDSDWISEGMGSLDSAAFQQAVR